MEGRCLSRRAEQRGTDGMEGEELKEEEEK